jgi:hypothetical protein
MCVEGERIAISFPLAMPVRPDVEGSADQQAVSWASAVGKRRGIVLGTQQSSRKVRGDGWQDLAYSGVSLLRWSLLARLWEVRWSGDRR